MAFLKYGNNHATGFRARTVKADCRRLADSGGRAFFLGIYFHAGILQLVTGLSCCRFSRCRPIDQVARLNMYN